MVVNRRMNTSGCVRGKGGPMHVLAMSEAIRFAIDSYEISMYRYVCYRTIAEDQKCSSGPLGTLRIKLCNICVKMAVPGTVVLWGGVVI